MGTMGWDVIYTCTLSVINHLGVLNSDYWTIDPSDGEYTII
jgi:hypothetical protein